MTTKANDNRDAILSEATETLSRLPTEALLPLLPFLGELSRERPRPLTAGMVRRALDRWRLLELFRAMKLETPDLSNRQIILRVTHRVASWGGPPGQRAARPRILGARTLERWVQEYNQVGPDGLAAGFAALIDGVGRPSRSPFQGPLNTR
jgi:hypothetical protein